MLHETMVHEIAVARDRRPRSSSEEIVQGDRSCARSWLRAALVVLALPAIDGGNEAAEMLAERDRRFSPDAIGIGIDGTQKILDLLPNLSVGRRSAFTGLATALHFRSLRCVPDE